MPTSMRQVSFAPACEPATSQARPGHAAYAVAAARPTPRSPLESRPTYAVETTVDAFAASERTTATAKAPPGPAACTARSGRSAIESRSGQPTAPAGPWPISATAAAAQAERTRATLTATHG